MKLKFTKMHGAGNDFVVIDGINQDIRFTPEQWKLLGDRRFGVGADQMLLVEKPTAAGCDFRYRIFNADGGEVEQCGNGSRAFVKFVAEKGLTASAASRCRPRLASSPASGRRRQHHRGHGRARTGTGPRAVDAENLQGQPQGDDLLWPLMLELGGAREEVLISVVSMGNPHAVQVVDDVDSAPVELSGPLIERHARFPNRVNAGFMQIVDRHHIRLRVFERVWVKRWLVARAPALRPWPASAAACSIAPCKSMRAVASCPSAGPVRASLYSSPVRP
jgi:diaminopimelate epimerase